MHTFKFSQAGIDSDMLTIALEPEAAALYVKHLPVEKRVDGKKRRMFSSFCSWFKIHRCRRGRYVCVCNMLQHTNLAMNKVSFYS